MSDTIEVGTKLRNRVEVEAAPRGTVMVSTTDYQVKTRATEGIFVFEGGGAVTGEYVVVAVPPASRVPLEFETSIFRRVKLIKHGSGSHITVEESGDRHDRDQVQAILSQEESRKLAHALLEAIGDEVPGDQPKHVGKDLKYGARVELTEDHRGVNKGTKGRSDNSSGVDRDDEYFVVFDNGRSEYVHYTKLVLA